MPPVPENLVEAPFDDAQAVTSKGQKTSSVLNRALSRIEVKIQAETIQLSD